ncbi:MAG: hypothetical protein ACI39U_03840 [Candidatus Cryptobacteroides sp.]
MKIGRYFLIAAAVITAMTACSKSPQDTSDKKDDEDGGSSTVQINMEGLTIDGQFPIVAWTGIDAGDTATKFGPMRDCGINVYLGWYDTQAEVMTALDNAEVAGVKLIIKSDELFTNTAAVVKSMKNHPALFGYHIEDEPEVDEIPTLASIVKSIQAVDDKHFCYINLYPNWAWGNIDGYMSKVTSFVSQTPVRFLSFDHYPIIEIDGVSSIRPEWYKNLEDIRKVARARNMPFWAFALALTHNLGNIVYPIPTLAELRLQMFSNLVYGAQGFQYFTYWGIYRNSQTQVYDIAKTVNYELQKLSKYFLGADVTGVWHTGENIPYGTKELSSMPTGISAIDTHGKDAIVSKIVKESNIFIAIVNKDYVNSVDMDISFSSKTWKIDKDGLKAAAESGKYTVGPGDIALFQVK